MKLSTGPNVEFREHVAEVPLHCARAQEKPGADLRIREPVQSQLSDLELLGSELISRFGRARTQMLAGSHRLALGALGKCDHPARSKHLMGGTEVRACLDPAPLAAQPLAVDELSTRKPSLQTRSAQVFDRGPIEAIGRLALGQ